MYIDRYSANGKGEIKISNFVVIAFICLLIPTGLMLAFLDSKSRTVYAFSIVGMAMALVASQTNSILLQLANSDYYLTTTNLTPVNEEILKAIPVLFFTFFIAEKRDEITPVAYSVGVGFAILENISIFLQSVDSLDIIWVISRCIGAGLMQDI